MKNNSKVFKVKDLIKELKGFNQEAQVFVASDEELNSIYWGFECAVLEETIGDKGNAQVVVYPLSGQEEEENY